MYAFSFEKFIEAFLPILSKLGSTMFLTVGTFVIAIVLALALAFLSLGKNPFLGAILKTWLSFFRGTPVLVQLFFFVYGLFPSIPGLNGLGAQWHAIICLSLAYSSYMSETIRGAILSVDRGQFEGGYSVGMSTAQTMVRVVLPQAFRMAVPPLSNNFLEVFKGTALASMVGITEMMLKAKMMSSKNLRFMETYLAVLFIYWALNILFTFLQKLLERHLNKKN
ncbi:MAG: amino acid ABC transporter permease [Clostridium sp.]|nr:amino acid ABC transporter permease [Clostridium sp.]